MMKVYVAGKLNDDAVGYIKNIHRMVIWADKLKKEGFSVYVPGIDFLMGAIIGDYEYSDYFDNSQPWLKSSDAMFLTPGWETSKGTKKEIKTAKRWKIPIFNKLEELVKYKNECEKI